jgi:hypothetical protein
MTDTPPLQKTDERYGPIDAKRFHEALVEFGFVHEDDRVRRIVIDVEANKVPKIYTERYGDSKVLKVLQTLRGVQISKR